MKPVALVAAVCLLLTLLTIDPAGNFLSLPAGPGLTVDESFNVEVGTYLVRAEAVFGLGAILPSSQIEIFRGSLNDHPPLGRLALGLVNVWITDLFDVPGEHREYGSTAAARVASAMAFALTVLLVGWVARRWLGHAAGFWAALVLATTPRAFGHAHIASLETFVGLTYAAGVFAVVELWGKRPTWRTGVVCGAFWGLCLLTKIQAVLLPIPVGLWALWFFRSKAVAPLAAMAGAGLVVFFVGWPYLWDAPVEHFREYFGRAGDRITLHLWFAGERYGDREVPVVYAPLMFVLTQPVVWLAGGVWGVRRTVAAGGDDVLGRRLVLLVASALFPVLFFAMPNFATYDGVRLFLVAYPIWAVVAGFGLAELSARVSPKLRPRIAAAVVAFGLLVLQSPLWLSHYSLLVGGTRGADALGFETTYWGDSLTRDVWQAIPEDSTVAVAPVLHQFQLESMAKQTPAIRERRLTLVPWSEGVAADFVVAFRRRADLPAELFDVFDDAETVVKTWDGAVVAAVVPLPLNSAK